MVLPRSNTVITQSDKETDMRTFKVIFNNGTVREYDALSAASLRAHLARWFTGFHLEPAR